MGRRKGDRSIADQIPAASRMRALRADWRRRVSWRLMDENWDIEDIALILDISPFTILNWAREETTTHRKEKRDARD